MQLSDHRLYPDWCRVMLHAAHDKWLWDKFFEHGNDWTGLVKLEFNKLISLSLFLQTYSGEYLVRSRKIEALPYQRSMFMDFQNAMIQNLISTRFVSHKITCKFDLVTGLRSRDLILFLLSPWSRMISFWIELFMQRIRIALSEVAFEVEMHRVRLVAPGKWMLCASFILPESVAFAKATSNM